MSWTILYKTDFIKVDEDKYIPLVIAGPNNCYEPKNYHKRGYERRTRSSCLWFGTDYEDIILSEKQIMNNIITEIDECIINNEGQRLCEDTMPYTMDYIKRNLGYFMGIKIVPHINMEVTNVRYKNFFRRAIKNAITLKQNPISIQFVEGEYLNQITIFTPEQLIEQLEDAQKKGWYIGSIISSKGKKEIHG